MEELEQRIWDEFKKYKVWVKGERGVRMELIRRIAVLVHEARKDRSIGAKVFRQIAMAWYADRKKEGGFSKDIGYDDKFHHSFFGFARHLDERYCIGIAAVSPWVRFIRLLRKVRYDIRKFFKKKRVNT